MRRFIDAHPKCCYCGGDAATTTEDHWPSRAIFDERKWPNGYVFPACLACNQVSADDEALFALLCRFSVKESKDDLFDQTEKLMVAVNERLPHIFQSLFLSANQVKAWLRETGQTLAHGQSTKNVMSLDHPEINERVKRCATKLFLSLHYHHTGQILPSQGGVFFRWFSNANTTDEIPFEVLAPYATEVPDLKWQRINLNDQFMYRYGAAPEGLASVFLVTFHNSIGMLGIAHSNIDKLSAKVPGDQVLRPFKHSIDV